METTTFLKSYTAPRELDPAGEDAHMFLQIFIGSLRPAPPLRLLLAAGGEGGQTPTVLAPSQCHRPRQLFSHLPSLPVPPQGPTLPKSFLWLLPTGNAVFASFHLDLLHLPLQDPGRGLLKTSSPRGCFPKSGPSFGFGSGHHLKG